MTAQSPDLERQWAAEKRDFVGDHRDELADERDVAGALRDMTADARERALDQRERELVAREAALGLSGGAAEAAHRDEARLSRRVARQEREGSGSSAALPLVLVMKRQIDAWKPRRPRVWPRLRHDRRAALRRGYL